MVNFMYPLAYFFQNLFSKNNLIDIFPNKLALTWKNKRLGNEEIGKRMNRFFVDELILEKKC